MRMRIEFMAAALLLALTGTPVLGAEEARGRELFNSLGCKGCHQLAGIGGTLGPALDKVGARMGAEQLQKKLIDPKAGNPKSTMPSYQRLPEKDIAALVDFLARQK